jgi:hypothetical protein
LTRHGACRRRGMEIERMAVDEPGELQRWAAQFAVSL